MTGLQGLDGVDVLYLKMGNNGERMRPPHNTAVVPTHL